MTVTTLPTSPMDLLDSQTIPDPPSLEQYIRELRTVPVGPSVQLVFENRQTLWFRMQELKQLVRMTRSDTVRTMLKWYEQLMPTASRITAAIWVGERGRRMSRELQIMRQAISLGRIALFSPGCQPIAGRLVPHHSSDHLTALAQWVEFEFTPTDVAELCQPDRSWQIQIESIGYCQTSPRIPEAVLRSLVQDLSL